MADGEHTLTMTLKLSDEAVRHLREEAGRLGLSLDAYASGLIERHIGDDDWAEDDRIAEEAERTGITYSVEEGMAVFDRALKAELTKRR
jgi:hypothetical protein